jgi:hypothetical protein
MKFFNGGMLAEMLYIKKLSIFSISPLVGTILRVVNNNTRNKSRQWAGKTAILQRK